MESKQIFYKMGRIPSKKSIQLDPALDLCSNQEEPQSGIQMQVNETSIHASSHSSKEEHAKQVVEILEQQDTTEKQRKRGKKGKNIKESQPKFEDQGFDRQRVDRPQMQKLIKIREMLKIFHEKTTLNSLLRKPITYSPFDNVLSNETTWFFQDIKLEIHKNVANVVYLTKMLFIALYMFFFPLTLLFENLADSNFAAGIKMAGLAFNCFDLTETVLRHYAMDNTNALSKQKYRKFIIEKRVRMFLQLFIVLATIISLARDHPIAQILFACLGLNINHFLQQLQKLEDEFLTATYLHKYWNLFNVIIKNLFVCHLLACTLIAITFINPGDNWMVPNNIDSLVWYQQYIWSYYFGTTIILTIGFGDLHANNSAEALFIIVISFFACVFFGYNINYIGNLINSIKQEQNQKNTKLKLLNSISKKSKVSKHVYEEISKYIVQESKIKQESNYSEEKKLLKELPESLRSSYLQEVNENLFNHLRQLIPFSNSAIQKLSLNIQARFCHPDQLIKGLQNQQNLIILQSGEVGYLTRAKYPSKLRNAIIQRISNNIHSQSKLICVELLLNEPLNYDIKSLDYSIIYEMSKEKFQESIISSKKDYQMYRELLDRCKFKLNEFALVKCRFCEGKLHSLFECPKLHYMPFRKTLPLKGGNIKQTRISYQRAKKQMQCEIIFQSKTECEIDQSSFTIQPSLTPKIKVQMTGQSRSSEVSRRLKGGSFRPSNEHMFITMQMVTQLRKDINNLKRSSFQNFQFALWENADCDEAFNYQHYFYKWNPDYLSEKEVRNTIISKTKSNRIRRLHRQASNN